MKHTRLLTSAAVIALLSIPIVSSAQGRGRDDNLRRQPPNSQSSRHRDDDRRNDNRRGNDRRDNDRRIDDRRGNDRRGNDRRDNGRHDGWDDRRRPNTVIVNYNTRHDDWHRHNRSSHRHDCRYDNGQWRYHDTRYVVVQRDDRRYDPGYGRYDPGYEYHRREETSREWRNLASLGGLLSIIGLLNNDDTLFFAGAAGALYSEYRFAQDKRSQDRIARARAYYFDQPYFYRDGHRFERRDVTRGGQKYFQFVRVR